MGSFAVELGSHENRFSSFYSDVLQQFNYLPAKNRGGSSLVLDSSRGELVRAPRSTRKEVLEAKAAMALKNHSEAERRRRERINNHLATLRNLVPTSNNKMDKAALLAEVISHVKELKKNVTEVSRGCIVPTDVDEVRVESDADITNKGNFFIKASLCCDDRPEILADLKRTLQSLQLKTVRAEICTMGGRVINVFVMTDEGNTEQPVSARVKAVQHALNSVLDRVTLSNFSPRTGLSSKRQRLMQFDSSSSSS